MSHREPSLRTAKVLEDALELITRGISITASDHGDIHRGRGYCASLHHASLGKGDKKIYRFKAPTDKYAHIKSIQAKTQGATIMVKLIKGATITQGGTLEDVISNLNDNSGNGAQSKLYDGNVEYTGGSTWFKIVAHGDKSGAGAESIKAMSHSSFIQSDYIEYVTKSEDTNYILEIENIDSKENAATDITIDMFFFELTGGIIK